MTSVLIEIPGSPDRIRGLKVLVQNGSGNGDMMQVHQLTLRTADGTSLSMIARSSSVHVSNGLVSTVYVRRPIEPLRFLQAETDLLTTLSHAGIVPDALMRDQISYWTNDAPGNGEVPGTIPYDWKTGISSQFHGLVLNINISPDPNGGWFYLLIFSAVTPDSIPGISPATQPAAIRTENTRKTSAKLLGTLSDIRGADARVSPAGMNEVDLLRPQTLSLTLPDAQTISINDCTASIMFWDGIAHGVFVRRPLIGVTFKEATEDLLRTLCSLHMEPDQAFRSMMMDWPDDKTQRKGIPTDRTYQAAFHHPIHGAVLTARICPDDEGKWYYYLIFSVGSKGTTK